MSQPTMIEIYTEMTPNPESLKFVTNRHILPNFQLDFRSREMSEGSALAKVAVCYSVCQWSVCG
jgi:hypothetical protein